MNKLLKRSKISVLISLFLMISILLPTFAEDSGMSYFNNLPKIKASDLIKNDFLTSTATRKTEKGIFIEQSIDEIIKVRPDLKEKIYTVLKEKNLLNKDGSIKKDVQIQSDNISTGVQSAAFLGTGTEYEYSGRYPNNGSMLADWTKQTVWQGVNKTSQAQSFTVSNSYTQGCTISAEVSINSTAALSEALSVSAGCKLTYSITQAATQQYGATIVVPANSTRTITGKAFVICYSYYQNYYVLGALISRDLVGVFVPTGVQWTLT
ncbi:hypothetical protein [Ruminiclostridium cellobioparum]|uniref:hypothetical protein n=1 Tax=Ruminiclostridium cellobioparum TaxID=29355 RepID=UPI0028AC3EB3|nr:hypothetical protein [Ruminiclostridium cellobioparum]